MWKHLRTRRTARYAPEGIKTIRIKWVYEWVGCQIYRKKHYVTLESPYWESSGIAWGDHIDNGELVRTVTYCIIVESFVNKMSHPMCLFPFTNTVFVRGIHNCQHYQKRTQSTLFCDPPPSRTKAYFEKLIFNYPV